LVILEFRQHEQQVLLALDELALLAAQPEKAAGEAGKIAQ
jgi:hypothetical protein